MNAKEILGKFYEANPKVKYISDDMAAIQIAQYERWVEENALPPVQLNVHSWFNHHWIGLVAFVALSMVGFVFLQLGSDDNVKIWNIGFKVALYWACCTAYSVFFMGVRFDQESFMARDPNSLSRYVGAVIIGTAVIIALG